LSGDRNCEWAAWFRAHYYHTKRPSNFDSTSYQVQHTTLLSQLRDRQVADGYTVTVEGQNEFRMKGKTGILSGKPDLVALKGDAGVVVDVKAATPKGAHNAQVMLYMWALPIAVPKFRGIKFDGQVVYQTRTSTILTSEIDETFMNRVGQLLRMICGDIPPARAPSARECRFCDVSADDCPDLIDAVLTDEPAITDIF
jgi:hypothetical protein